MYQTPAQRRRRRRQRRSMLLLTLAVLATVLGVFILREMRSDAAVVADTPSADEVMASANPAGPTTTGKPTTTSSTMKLLSAKRPTKVAQGLDAYRGLGVWVDLYDIGPGGPFQPTALPDLAAKGVQTLYLQVGRANGMADKNVIGPILLTAHQNNMAVVAWYLPEFEDVNTDVTRVEQAHQFDFQGHRFDGLSIDMEDEYHVIEHNQRSARLVEFSKKMRTKIPADYPVAACILPPAQIEIVSLNYWPDFPYKQIEPHYQIWQTMGYWTDRTKQSGYRDAYEYTRDSVELLRTRLGRADVLVHPIGGQAAKTTTKDIADFRRAVNDTHGVGLSIYDYASTPKPLWDELTRLPPSANPEGPMPTMPGGAKPPEAPAPVPAPPPSAPGAEPPPSAVPPSNSSSGKGP